MSNGEDKFVRALLRAGHQASEEELRRLYASVPDKALLDKLIDTYGKPPPAPIGSPNVSSYANSATAVLSFTAFFAVSITLTVDSIKKAYAGSGSGLIWGAGPSLGTLYFNNVTDLQGASDFNCNLVSLYTNCNFIRNNSVYATFSGASLPWLGTSYGSGRWGDL